MNRTRTEPITMKLRYLETVAVGCLAMLPLNGLQAQCWDMTHNKKVEKTGAGIAKLRVRRGEIYHAKASIDATYEGDLMAAARVSHTVGREPGAPTRSRRPACAIWTRKSGCRPTT